MVRYTAQLSRNQALLPAVGIKASQWFPCGLWLRVERLLGYPLYQHELAVRAAILEHLSFVTEPETIEEGFRQRMGEELALVVNAELEQLEGFGGIERILFTEFLMQ